MDLALRHFLKLWNGNSTLAIAFWGTFIPVAVVGKLFTYSIKNNLIDLSMIIVVIFGTLFLFLKVTSLIFVWKNANNTKLAHTPIPLLSKVFVAILLTIYIGIFILTTLSIVL